MPEVMEGPHPKEFSCDACYWSTRPATCFVCRFCTGFDSHAPLDDCEDAKILWEKLENPCESAD